MKPADLLQREFERSVDETMRRQRQYAERHFEEQEARRRAAEHRATQKPEAAA